MDDELAAIRERKRREIMESMGDSSGAPVDVTDQNFEDMLKKHKLMVVDCWAPWCGPCRMLAPTIDALAKDYKGKITFGKVNTDNNMGISGKFQIMSIPTLLLFKDGKLVDKMVGAAPRPMIEERLKKLL